MSNTENKGRIFFLETENKQLIKIFLIIFGSKKKKSKPTTHINTIVRPLYFSQIPNSQLSVLVRK